MSRPAFRFAPSPNGPLHLGHALSALLNREIAAATGGRLLLRMENIDPARSRPEWEALIREDLHWLGLRWEEPVRRQSEHMAEYAAALASLAQRGLAYPCFCSRGDVARAVARRAADTGAPPPVDPDGAPLYPGTCRGLDGREAARRRDSGAPHVWRLRTSRALRAAEAAGPLRWGRVAPDGSESTVRAEPLRWGDAVIGRRDVPTSYHLAVTLDDALQGVTHVVRGCDLESATDLHVLLGALFGLPRPRYHHHRLLRDAAGEKLAKSCGSPSLAAMRAAGLGPGEVERTIAAAISAEGYRMSRWA